VLNGPGTSSIVRSQNQAIFADGPSSGGGREANRPYVFNAPGIYRFPILPAIGCEKGEPASSYSPSSFVVQEEDGVEHFTWMLGSLDPPGGPPVVGSLYRAAITGNPSRVRVSEMNRGQDFVRAGDGIPGRPAIGGPIDRPAASASRVYFPGRPSGLGVDGADAQQIKSPDIGTRNPMRFA